MHSKHRSTITLRRIVAVVAAGAVIGLSGCVVAAAAAGAGAVAYVKASLNATLGEDVPTVAQATAQAVTALHFFEISDKRDALSAEFVLRDAKDDRITIKLTKTGAKLTKVAIRVGMLGNEELSRSILDEIKKNL